MAETVSAIIGAVSATVSLAHRIYTYISSAKNAPKEANDFAAQVYVTQGALEMLKAHLSRQRSEAFERTSVLLAAASGCRQQLEAILKKVEPLAKGKSRTIDRLVWPFHESDTRHATESLHHYVQIFAFVYNLDGLSIMAANQQDATGQLRRKLDGLTEKQDDAASHITLVLEALRFIRDSVDPIRNGITQLEQHIKDNRLSRLLDYLPALSFGEKHRDLQQRRTEGLGQWLLYHDEFASWYDGSCSNFALWCMGAPGAGKTYLTSVVIDFLKGMPNRDGTRPRVLYFYYDYKHQEQQTPFNVLSCLLRQLLSTHSTIPEAAAKFNEEVTTSAGFPSWETLTSTFLNVCSHSGPVYVVLDALDECDENKNRRPILWLLQRLMSTSVRTFVTSRPHCPDINEMLTPCTQILIEASESDIRAFLHAEIDNESRRTKRTFESTLCNKIVWTIIQSSCGIFLVPALQIDFVLSHTNDFAVRKALSRLPSGLKANLDLAINRMKSQDNRSDAMGQLALNTLMWLSHVKRQLSIDELRHALATKRDTTHLNPGAMESSDIIVKACLGLVTVDEETSMVRFVHQTVNEYLQERTSILFPEANRYLGLACLSYLMLQHFYVEMPSTLEGLKALIGNYPFLKYSGCYWGHHASVCFEGDVASETNKLLSTKEGVEFSVLVQKWCTGYQEDYNHTRGTGRLDDKGYLIRHSTPCHVASKFGIHALAKDQLDNGFDVNSQDSQGQTPLMIAASCGHETILKMLLSVPTVNPNLIDNYGETALVHAVSAGQLEAVVLLLAHPNIDINLGYPLTRASEDYFQLDGSAFEPGNKGKIAALLLVRHDTNVNVLDANEVSLWQSVATNLDYGALRLLMARDDFDPSQTDHRSSRTISDNCNYMLNSDILTVEGLVNSTLILRAMEQDRRTPMEDFQMLNFASHIIYYAFSSVDMQQDSNLSTTDVLDRSIWVVGDSHRQRLRAALQQEGCTLSMTDSKGRTFLHFAACEQDLDHAEAFADHLLKHGLDVDCRDHSGSTPLQLAVQKGPERMHMIQWLLDHGANKLAVTGEGETILHKAAASVTEYSPLFDDFVEAGVDVNAISCHGYTALHYAAYESGQIVKFLLSHGANPNICSMKGLPLHLALYEMQMGAIKEFLSYEVDLNALDTLGRSCFEYMSRYPPLAELLGLERVTACRIPPSEVAVRHVLEHLKSRISRILDKFDEASLLFNWLGKQLLVLGDDRAAKVALAADFMVKPPEKEDEEPIIKNKYRCWNCPTTTGFFYECRDCGTMTLCSKCVTECPTKETPWCSGHTFLEVPSRNFVNFQKGVVNEEGQTPEEWLKELQVKYSSINDEKDLDILRARNFNLDNGVDGAAARQICLHWTCSCNYSGYDIVTEYQGGATKALAKRFQDAGVMVSLQPLDPSDTVGNVIKTSRLNVEILCTNLIVGLARAICCVIRTIAPSYTISRTSSQNALLNSNPPSAARISTSTANSPGERSGFGVPLEPITAAAAITSSGSPRNDFLLLCINDAKWLITRDDLNVSPIVSDNQLFSSIRQKYLARRDWIKRFISLKSPQKIVFVKFTLREDQEVDCLQPNQIPQAMDRHYSFTPRTPGIVPLFGNSYLMHRFTNPHCCRDSTICLDQFPKRIERRPEHGVQPDMHTGWGLYLEEGFDLRRISLCAMLGLIISLVFGIAWSVKFESVQDGFTVAAYILAFETVTLATIQLAPHLA